VEELMKVIREKTEKIKSYLTGNAESIADMASGRGDQAKKLFGR
jgi:hypothetical protein